jgi:CheY-like chemotaxis protein
MNHKVLLADDSLTIQKVIKITLANQPYDIVDASSEDELFQKLPQVQPKLVFLDFNLSDKHTGYELTTRIREILPSAKVLLLLGTFDNIDDAAFEKCGASDKIVKPFDSNKFIAICRQLIDSFDEGPSAPAQAPTPSTLPKSAPEVTPKPAEEQWTMSHTTERKLPSPPESKPEKTNPKQDNPLHQEMSNWGMSVPGVIGGSSSRQTMDLPPVIEEKATVETAPPRSSANGVKLPSQEDLDYPTIEEMATSTEESKQPKSNLISIDSFRQDNTSEFEIQGNYVQDESNVQSIQEQIRDEVEEDLWRADEFEDLKKEISSKVEQMSDTFKPTLNDFDETLFRPIDDKDSISWNDIGGEDQSSASSQINFGQDTHAMSNLHGSEMEELIKKYVKEYMDDMFKNKVEKVAWEVIPDLAENLIRQELSKIAEKILKDSK